MAGYLYLLLTIILFSSMEVSGRLIYMNIGPFAITFLRFLIGFLVIFIYSLFSKNSFENIKRMEKRDLRKIFILGFLNVFLSMGILQIAIHKGNASIPAIIISSNPLFVYLFICIKEKDYSLMHLIKIFSGILGICGVILYSNRVDLSNIFLSFILALIASIIFAGYTVSAGKLNVKYGNRSVTMLTFLFGIIWYIPLIFMFERHPFSNIGFNQLLIILYMGVFVTGIGYLSYFEGLKKIPVHIGSMVFFMKPVIASVFAFFILKEKLSALQIVSIGFILYAIIPNRVTKAIWKLF